jgi:hypothetical protein
MRGPAYFVRAIMRGHARSRIDCKSANVKHTKAVAITVHYDCEKDGHLTIFFCVFCLY